MKERDHEELRRRQELSLDEAQAEVSNLIRSAQDANATELDIAGYRLLDLSNLVGLANLKSLDCSRTEVNDLAPLAGLTSLQSLDCSRTRVNDLAPLAGLTNLQLLDCGGTQVGNLAPLAMLSNLQSLNCGRTQINDLAPLAELTSLQTLTCGSTQVSDLAPLAGLDSLQSLDCADTKVSDLAPLARLARLHSLNCYGTRISNLAPLAGLTNLRSLDCNITPVSDLAPLTGLRRLQSLKCILTQVSDLGPLAGIDSLQSLDCHGTQVSDLTPLAGLDNLESLVCWSTGVSDVAPLASLKALRTLDCDFTEVNDLAPLAALTSLQSLHLWDTPVRDLAPLAGLDSLRSLNCQGTKISDLAPLAGLDSLRSLNCQGTTVSDLAPLRGLDSLRSLNCSNTEVSELAPLRGLASLQSVDCSGTKVNDLAPLASLASLQTLDCNHISAREWPQELFSLPHLVRVFARGARIGSIPAEDLSQGYDDNCLDRLRSYFEDLEAGAAPLDRVKLIVLGNGQVGKTQLRRWLLNSPENPLPFDPGVPSTHGIEVLRGAIAVPAPNGSQSRSLDASLWDFGGQDIYHGTHGLFMKTRAIFVLCWCPQQEDSREQELGGLVHQNQPMGYWLDYVRQLAGTGNPVLIVQTQCDSASVEEPHRHAALDRSGFDFVKLVQFSASTDRGGAALKEALWEAAEWLKAKHGIPLIGEGRLAVLNQLERWRSEDVARPPEEREHKLLTQEKFAELCAEAGGIATPLHLLNFLHHAGVVFYREGLFADRIIIDQNWAVAAIYTAFDRKRCYPLLKANRGRFTADLIGELAWPHHSPDEQQLFLSMMESCGIAFVHTRSRDPRLTEYIAPDLLPARRLLESVIESRWHGPDAPVVARLRFALLHKGLIRQILASVGQGERINAEYWATGMLFYEGNRQSDAMIEAIEDETGWSGEVAISCRSGGASELLELLVEEVGRVSERIGLHPERLTTDPEERRTPIERDEAAAPIEIAARPRTGPQWYVSYAWGDTTTPEGIERGRKVDDLCAKAARRGITIIRDRDAIGNGDSIRRFMERLIEGDRIIVILSAKYLTSANCMFELHESWRKQQADADLFAATVRAYCLPCAQIGDAVGRAKISKYWTEKVDQTSEYLEYLGAKDLADRQLAKHYANSVGDILYMINDRISPREWKPFLEWAFKP